MYPIIYRYQSWHSVSNPYEYSLIPGVSAACAVADKILERERVSLPHSALLFVSFKNKKDKQSGQKRLIIQYK